MINDYLASRDAQWMGRLYNFLGLTVGINLPTLGREEKQAAYNATVSPAAPNSRYGFDYLRDKPGLRLGRTRAAPLNYAIVDEVDSILIDEARTPLIISLGQSEDQTTCAGHESRVPPMLTPKRRKAE